MPPLSNKRDQGTIGADLIVTYYSDLAQCEILPTGSRYTNAGNFKAGTFLPFFQPGFIQDLYPRLLSTTDEESSGLPLVLSMFNAEARTATLKEDWEGKWFSIVARLLPNKLTFHGVRLDGWEGDETESVQVALALPRDGGLTPYVPSPCTELPSMLTFSSVIPRQLGGSDESAPWPTSSAHVSFAGPVDLDTFHIKDSVWPKQHVYAKPVESCQSVAYDATTSWPWGHHEQEPLLISASSSRFFFPEDNFSPEIDHG
jgi:hypothetical protein